MNRRSASLVDVERSTQDAGGHGAFSRPTGHRQPRRVLDPSPPAKAATRTPASASHGRGSPPAPEEPPHTTATHRDRETAAAIPFGPTRGVARPPLKDPSLLRTQSGSPRYLFTNRSDDISGSSAGPATQGDQRSHSKPDTISIAKREDVAILDSFIGQKT